MYFHYWFIYCPPHQKSTGMGYTAGTGVAPMLTNKCKKNYLQQENAKCAQKLLSERWVTYFLSQNVATASGLRGFETLPASLWKCACCKQQSKLWGFWALFETLGSFNPRGADAGVLGGLRGEGRRLEPSSQGPLPSAWPWCLATPKTSRPSHV